MISKTLISVVIPVYGCRTSLLELYIRLKKTLEQLTSNFEIIMVNDASPDGAWETIKELSIKDNRVKGIDFSRNFGQHYAITAGLDCAKGEWIVVMDCDLQDQPEEIINLYNKALEGFEIVYAQRTERQDNFFKKLNSKLFYKVFSYLTNTKQDSSVANFGIYKLVVIKAILQMKDSVKYFPTMSQWVGFKKAYLPVSHDKRLLGKSAYNFKSLLNLAFNNIISFSDKLLKLVIKLGFLVVLVSIFLAIYYFVKFLLGDIVILGYSSLIISIWFLSGINIMIVGIVGIYVGKVFDKVKDRPNYIIKEKNNL